MLGQINLDEYVSSTYKTQTNQPPSLSSTRVRIKINKFFFVKKEAVEKYQIEPMMWAYMENVEGWFQEHEYVKYGKVFNNIWAASAFKGASGELTTITSVNHHYLNQISWNRIIHAKKISKVCNFVGVAITGWSR